MKSESNYHIRSALAIIGFFVVSVGLMLIMYWELILNNYLYKKISLSPNSDYLQQWISPPSRIQIDIYLFNWTNPEDFYNTSTKPILQQMGPYRYIEKTEKYDIRWHPHNSSVSYRKRSFYYFDEKGSHGKLSDEITTLNFIAVGASKIVTTWEYFRRQMATFALNVYDKSISIRATADELLYTGRKDLLVNVAPMLINEVFPFDKFGYSYMRNGSSDFWGRYNIMTGVQDITQMGKVHTWNYMTHTNKFSTYCGKVNGSAGELHPPNQQINGSITYFISDFCRSLTLYYTEQTDFNGVQGFKYTGGLRTLDNGSIYTENKCFCADECLPSGVMYIGSCWFKLPIYISYPHFYNADRSYVDAVNGLNPNKADHELFVILEPKSGLTIDMSARVQFNALVEPNHSFRLFRNAPKLMFPILWFEEKVQIPHDHLGTLKLFALVMAGGKITGGIIALTGMLMIALYLKDILYNKRHTGPFVPVPIYDISMAEFSTDKVNCVQTDTETSLSSSSLSSSNVDCTKLW